jgi:hypothetical protein
MITVGGDRRLTMLIKVAENYEGAPDCAQAFHQPAGPVIILLMGSLVDLSWLDAVVFSASMRSLLKKAKE